MRQACALGVIDVLQQTTGCRYRQRQMFTTKACQIVGAKLAGQKSLSTGGVKVPGAPASEHPGGCG